MSGDPYIRLASAITGRPEDDITLEERTRTKHALFQAIYSVSAFPDNDQLRAALDGKIPVPLIRKGDVIDIVYGTQRTRVAVTHVEAHIITTADIEE